MSGRRDLLLGARCRGRRQAFTLATLATVVWTLATAAPPYVTVGDVGNPPDVYGHGAVAYEFRIGTYEVTNAQYTEFLNAVAAADAVGLYHPEMAIYRLGASGSFTYTTDAPDHPVTHVSWLDAARFANWLHHGQPSGGQTAATTEDGAYTLVGAGGAVARNPGAQVWLPSEDEWAKAAHYQGSAAGTYAAYATGTTEPPAASLSGASPASANYRRIAGGVTPVGSYTASSSYYGTFDQAGNVWEWTDTEIDGECGLRGGSWDDYELLLSAAYRDSELPTLESPFIGFRVAAVSGTQPPANTAPIAVADDYGTTEDTVLTVARPGILTNDTDAEGDALSAGLVSGPAHGTLALSPDGSFVYTPAADYSGSDSFSYQASDRELASEVVVVSLAVSAVNDAPVALPDAYSVTGGTVLTVPAPGVLGNDSDSDGDGLSAVLVSGPAHGILTLNANGSFVYTPAAGYSGSDGFSYQASDSVLQGAAAAVSITVLSPPPPPAFSLTALDPNTRQADIGEFILRVTGTGFTRGSSIVWNGIRIRSRYLSPTSLSAKIKSDYVKRPGTFMVTVSDRVLGTTNALPFLVYPNTSHEDDD